MDDADTMPRGPRQLQARGLIPSSLASPVVRIIGRSMSSAPGIHTAAEEMHPVQTAYTAQNASSFYGRHTQVVVSRNLFSFDRGKNFRTTEGQSTLLFDAVEEEEKKEKRLRTASLLSLSFLRVPCSPAPWPCAVVVTCRPRIPCSKASRSL